VRAYRNAAYNFLAVTDHRTITDLTCWNRSDFLTIPSVEADYDANAVGQSYHLVVLGFRSMVGLPADSLVEDAVAGWSRTGGVIVLGHPYWSGMSAPDMFRLFQLTGLEVCNTGSQVDLGKGLASVHRDGLLSRSRRWWGYAVDDAHWVRLDGRPRDAFQAWVWVKAERLSEPAILESLRRGQFYSSTRPRIYDFRVRDGVAELRCSDVAEIRFIGHTQWGSHERDPHGAPVSEAEYVLTGNERYLRAECIDAQGHVAWTNPIFL
jgi:hypothetical protein